jgi:two-component system invasion response regulator UvrY
METIRVLVVDDHPAFREAARSVIQETARLSWAGEARSGEEALRRCRPGEFELVLMDVHMPGIGGVEAARRIRRDCPAVNVVLLSSYAADEIPPEVSTCGALGYLEKNSLAPEALERIGDLVRSGVNGS